MFESGNLEKAVKKGSHEYELHINVDTNTRGHQQWFYFSVRNMRRGACYTFKIVNFTKPFILYKKGMRIAMRSKKAASEWELGGEDIKYYRTTMEREGWCVPRQANFDDEEEEDDF